MQLTAVLKGCKSSPTAVPTVLCCAVSFQVAMRQVTLEAMESLLLRYRGRYTAVVGFQPTGWAAGPGGRGGSATSSRKSSSVRPSRRLQRGTVVQYKVRWGGR
jgi:DNA repair metallo-beta-lactamase